MAITPELWTHSRLSARQRCPMSEHLRYEEKLVPIGRSMSLDVGSAIHKGLETRSVEEALKRFDNIYPNTQEESDDLEIARATVEAALTVYFERYATDEALYPQRNPELKFELPAIMSRHHKSRKHRIAGKIDDVWTDEYGNRWLVEYKTSSKLDASYFDRLMVDGQVTLYCYALKRLGMPVAGVIYRVIRKPSIRIRKGETAQQFAVRLTQDYRDRPDFYFEERRLYRSDADLDSFEQSLWQQIKLADAQHKAGQNFMHTCNCSVYGACRYLPICTKENGAEALFEIKEPHQELQEEEPEE